MKLTSVLNLKEELKSEVTTGANPVPRVFASVRGAIAPTSDFAIMVDETHTRRPASVSVALGVAAGRSRNDYRLGARVQLTGRAAIRVAEHLVVAAHGEADVRIVPVVRKRAPTPAWFRRRRRPLEAGVSVGHFRITAGTLGFVVEDQHSFYMLSNNHVLADVNSGEPGDPCLQPGPLDLRARRKPEPKTVIGVLDRFVPISFQRANVVDCAVAEILPDIEFFPGWTEALPGIVKGVKEVTFDDLRRPVSKAGRTTGVRHGVISQVNVDRLRVDMGDETPRIALFSDQVEIEGTDQPFSDGGDSGSLIVDTAGYARALLFAGGPEAHTGRDLTYANQLHIVLQKLGVQLVLT
ncbi:MAG TPA: hypothetical protein VMO47_13620 [Rhodothermales bacterium]|nr:hypothetical protein [Rhodothermales bacterium]